MNNKKIILGLIPARGGSKGVPEKNIRIVLDKPLIAYAIECGLKCSFIDHLIVSTDSQKIAKIAINYGAEVPFIRPKELAEDTTPMLPVIEHTVKSAEIHYAKEIEAVILLDPTGPLRCEEDIKNALNVFKKTKCDAVVSGHIAHRNPYFNMVEKKEEYIRLVKEKSIQIGSRQAAPEVFDLNTVVWIYSRYAIMNECRRIPQRTRLYRVPAERALDLDTELDFEMLEFLMTKNRDLANAQTFHR